MPPNETASYLIDANKHNKNSWKELWQYRELFLFLAWRDIIVRYKQTVIGILWAIIRPILTMIILTIVFGTFAQLPSNGIPYPILVYSALLPWMLFSNSFSDASRSLVSNANILTKVYFPRIIIPVSTIIVNIVDFAVSFGIFIGIMVWFQFVPTWVIVFLPLFLIITLAFSLGAGILIAAFDVKYRDFQFVVPFIIQFGLYLSPVGYSLSVIPAEWQIWFALNPMTGIIEGFRWSLIGGELNLLSVLISIIFTVIVLIVGLWYFNKTEETFTDII